MIRECNTSASNTSALPITKTAKALSCPEKVVGMHHFSPVHNMQALQKISLEDRESQTSSR